MNPDVDKAFHDTPRNNFLRDPLVEFTEYNVPIPIGFGQTNSQPYTVEKMLEWLEVEPGDTILDVGSGSGWTTALLSRLTSKKGKVTAVEIVPELVEFGSGNCQRLGIENVTFHLSVNKYGWPKDAPYDRILVSASAETIPDDLIKQLARQGRMVIPVKNSILVIDKDNKDRLEVTSHPGFTFVPLLDPKQ